MFDELKQWQLRYSGVHRQSIMGALFSSMLAILMTLLLTSILLWSLDFAIAETLWQFFISPLMSEYEIAEVIMRASILAMIALGLIIGFRANVWNIGAEGQLISGAIAGSLVALYVDFLPSALLLILMMIAGIAGGILWASIPAWLKNRFDASEILTSLLLVYIAQLLLSYLVHGPLRDPMGFNFPHSAYFADAAIYPILLEGTRLSITPILVMFILPIAFLLIKYSYLGYQLNVSGHSQRAARYAGFSNTRLVWFSFVISGSLAGLAGISEVSANISQLVPHISPGYGFTAIIIAFLGRLNPFGVMAAALLISLIHIGSESAQITLGLPVSIGGIFQGLLLFCLLAVDFLQNYRLVYRPS